MENPTRERGEKRGHYKVSIISQCGESDIRPGKATTGPVILAEARSCDAACAEEVRAVLRSNTAWIIRAGGTGYCVWIAE
jgi:hypothetical protein